MIAIGSKKQEDKVAYLGNVAKQLFPEITKDSFEDAFRHGVDIALIEHGYKQWGDVISEQPLTRKHFFDSILSGSKAYLLRTGLNGEQVSVLLLKLSKKNRRYLG